MSTGNSPAPELSPIKRALLEIRDLRARVATLESLRDDASRNELGRHEPIAIVGMSVRAPGGVRTVERFAELLWSGTDAISEVPSDRWSLDEWFDESADAPGKMYTRFGGFIDDVDRFDAEFFGIAPVEAASMDPQQRLLLELAWEALENAGHAPTSLAGTRTGVYLGIANSDYGRALLAHPDLIDPYFTSGNAYSIAAGRVAYVLGLHGPAVAIDSACSSSLVALHLSCQALRSGECDFALAGGVNLILTPELNINFSKAGMMSRDGRCRTFDAKASGYVRGEGGGLIVLRRLSDAIAGGDRVLAIVRGSAVNQDGRSNGLTAPNGPSQERVVRDALRAADVAPAAVGYVEAHGTGTSLGDPIEVNALGAVLSEGRNADTPVMIGSVKTNIGHLEAAAGVAGLIKAVLALQRGEIPAHLHFDTPNPHIAWDDLPVVVPTKPTPFPTIDGRRIAAVSSFGFSGTNAHVILEAAQPTPTLAPSRAGSSPAPRAAQLLALSARDAEALRQVVKSYVEVLRGWSDGPDGTIADLCATANTGRAHFVHRVSVSGENAAALVDGLVAWLAGEQHPRVVAGAASPDARVGFLFPGQGSQYPGMGRALYDSAPAFHDAFDACIAALDPLLDRSLREVIFPADNDGALLERTEYAQPALFAIEYALAALWRSWGVEPDAVMGHSFGEYAAACVAGVFSLEDAAKIVVARGRLAAALPPGGAMAVVEASESEVRARIERERATIAIAAFNGPTNTVVSGEQSAVEAIVVHFAGMHRRVKRLARVSYASHSALVEPMLEPFEREVSAVAFAAPAIRVISNLTGEPADLALIGRARYWRDHLREPVRFSQSIRAMAAQGVTHFIEVSPQPVLLGMAAESVSSGTWLPSLREDQPAWNELLWSLQHVYAAGVAVDWVGLERGRAWRRIELPTYPFQRKRHWIDAVNAPRVASATAPVVAAPVIDAVVVSNTVPSDGAPHDDAPPPGAPIEEPTIIELWPALVRTLDRESLRGPLDLNPGGYPAKWNCLARITNARILATLQELGAFTRAGQRHTVDSLLNATGILPIHRQLVGRWLTRLVSARALARVDDEYVATGTPLGTRLAELWAEADRVFADNRELLAYVRNSADRLTAIVTGRQSPLESLFPDGSFDLAVALYERSTVQRYVNALAASAVEAVQMAMPQSRALRVLEVGAGTGGTTSAVLRALDADRVRYTFSDVSEGFFDAARRRFGEFTNLSFSVFDLERDAAGQGYEAESFDLIISANAVHAVRDLRAGIQQLAGLLAPGGVLVLVESTDHFAFFDITTGLIEGWQHFADDLRTDNPLLVPERWEKALQDGGFEMAQAWPSRDTLTDLLGQHVIVATMPGAPIVSVPARAAAPKTAQPERAQAPERVEPDAGVRATILSALPSTRLLLMADMVRGEVIRILRLDPSSPPTRRDRLMDLGMDSLMAVQLRNALDKMLELDRSLPSTLMFDYPTIDAIAKFLLERITPAEVPNSNGTSSADVPVSAQSVAGMSDDEIAALLAEEHGK
ncbi:MAG TPA: beta-ketoacyl synthase N-terminal-like domain-containing protein [Gemmatimonadaceae bacterium]|jgi:acyl transferase domain-containing protein/SAM-dependent methyltransferase/acyl carrier protein